MLRAIGAVVVGLVLALGAGTAFALATDDKLRRQAKAFLKRITG